MFLSPMTRAFDVLNIQLKSPENQQLLFHKLFYWFTCVWSLIKNIQIVILLNNILVNTIPI
jgi:hypothetical protein